MKATFCAYCNRPFSDGRGKCVCGSQTFLITESHVPVLRAILDGSPLALFSGSGSATISDPPPPSPISEGELKAEATKIFKQFGS